MPSNRRAGHTFGARFVRQRTLSGTRGAPQRGIDHDRQAPSFGRPFLIAGRASDDCKPVNINDVSPIPDDGFHEHSRVLLPSYRWRRGLAAGPPFRGMNPRPAAWGAPSRPTLFPRSDFRRHLLLSFRTPVAA